MTEPRHDQPARATPKGPAAHLVPWVASILTILGTLVGVWQFNENLKVTLASSSETRVQDFRKSFADSRMTVYMRMADAVGKIIALAPGDGARKEAEALFHQTYWGQMIVVEDTDVKKAMIAFDDCLSGRSDVCASEVERQVQLPNLSVQAVTALRLSMGKVPDAKLEDLYRIERGSLP